MEEQLNSKDYSKELYERYNSLLEEYNLLDEEKNRISQDIKTLKNNILIIDELYKEKNLDEVYVPIFNGVFMKAKILDKENFFMLSSDKYAIVENKDSIKVRIKENIEELKNIIEKINSILKKKKDMLNEIEDSI